MMQTYPGNGGVGDTDRCRWAPASLSRMSSRWNQRTPFIPDTILKVCSWKCRSTLKTQSFFNWDVMKCKQIYLVVSMVPVKHC